LNITSTAVFAKQLDKLVREIAGNTDDAIALERARAIAQAEFDLERVRRAKVALIERASAFGELDPPRLTVTQMIRLLNAFDRGRFIVPKPVATSAALPRGETARFSTLPVQRNLATIYSCETCKTNPIFLNRSKSLPMSAERTRYTDHSPSSRLPIAIAVSGIFVNPPVSHNYEAVVR
jgi:hypothetical protein